MADTPRQELRNTLPKIRERIQQIRTRQRTIGEQNTKATLIVPVLSALGWNLEELDEVLREYKRKPQDNPVDYALFLIGSPRLFIEAKELETSLIDRKWVSQVLGYATVVGVEWCVLTNGDEYRLYNAHAAVDVEEKLFRAVRISEQDQEEHTLSTLELLSKDKMGENLLNVLWKAHFVDRHVKTVLEELLVGEDSGLIRLIQKRKPGLSPSEIRDSLKRADIQINFPVITPLPQLSEPVIRRKSPVVTVSKAEGRQEPDVLGVQAFDLIQAGLISPPLQLEREYRGVHLEATIQQDGRVVFGGEVYNSLSTAAGMARKTVVGAPPGRLYPQTNGWIFWRYRDPETGALKEIDLLRQLYRAQQAEHGEL